MNLKTQWLLLALFAAVPYLVLGAAGAWWLYDSGWWLWWVFGAALFSLAGWPLVRWLQRRTPLAMPAAAAPIEDWSPRAREAWAAVEAIAKRMETEDVPLDRPQLLFALAREVVETVAQRLHDGSTTPVLETPVPHVLQIVELVARDLREACSANIPGSHILTISELIKLRKLIERVPALYRVYRLLSFVLDPASALARELSGMAQQQVWTASAAETKRWALQFAIRRTGTYAIELYSGQLLLRDAKFADYTTKTSQRAIATDERRTTTLAQEPLRILVLGQVKAGKSSLINAVFGETRAAVDVVPRTTSVDAYLLERDGQLRAIILDTAGYEDATRSAAATDQGREEILKCDLVVLVSSSLTAAHDADRRLLDEVRGAFQRTPDREFPPLVVVLSHIDQLRPFREWNPPYDLAHPTGAKAQMIRQAMEGTAADLQVDIERVVPVCLLEGKLYNVEDGLIPTILSSLGAAERLKYLRCLREFKDEEYWSRLGEQAANAGRIVLTTGLRLLGAAADRLK